MIKAVCPKCGKNNFLQMFAHVFNRSARPEGRQWPCSGCRATLRLTLESAMKIWMTGLAGIVILILAINIFAPVISRLAISAGKVYLGTFVLILVDFCLAACLMGKIEVISQP